ncbi:MAG: hypothetical protein II988_03410 [Clostridia bacterium]|nr:hypothetical protein [Clostridia bacterium]
MELTKRKYNRAEVQEIINKISEQYEQGNNELKEKVVELFDANKRLLSENDLLKSQSDSVVKALSDARDRASQIENSAVEKYNATLLSLKNFLIKWKVYFDYLSEKYPYYQTSTQSLRLINNLRVVLDGNSLDQSSISSLDNELSKNMIKVGLKVPDKSIQDYIASTGDNGFNLDEVLNPGELKLEDLCKELGLLEEND